MQRAEQEEIIDLAAQANLLQNIDSNWYLDTVVDEVAEKLFHDQYLSGNNIGMFKKRSQGNL